MPKGAKTADADDIARGADTDVTLSIDHSIRRLSAVQLTIAACAVSSPYSTLLLTSAMVAPSVSRRRGRTQPQVEAVLVWRACAKPRGPTKLRGRLMPARTEG